MSVKRALYSLLVFIFLNVDFFFSSACLLLSGEHADVVTDVEVCLCMVQLFSLFFLSF